MARCRCRLLAHKTTLAPGFCVEDREPNKSRAGAMSPDTTAMITACDMVAALYSTGNVEGV